MNAGITFKRTWQENKLLRHVEITPIYEGDRLGYFYCFIDESIHVSVMIDDDANWIDLEIGHTNLSEKMGEMIENNFA